MKPRFLGVRRIHLPFSLPFPFIVALAAGAGLRLVAMIGYPGALWFAGDSYVYTDATTDFRPTNYAADAMDYNISPGYLDAAGTPDE